ncbi:MAG: hypothetical protein IPH00_16535 [Flavobacteriales bacterium]|nr:hypothetical protein [Flavobacteriales bacterium]MBK7247262.1 hypothetical protein [Flavobacteriales bacterium]HQY04116.1 hypothetical protein [Flavobacteriales bacterium]
MTIVLSMGAGMLSWFGDPVVWRAVAVAALCGFAGGVAKGAGFWAWRLARRERTKRRLKNRRP